jgi:Uma2 family endonuclease
MNLRIDKDIMSPEDLDLIIDGDHYEFAHGMPVEKNMGAESDGIAAEILTLLNTHVRANGLGRMFGSQTGYRCFPHDRSLLRKPDVSFIARGRLAKDERPKGDVEIAPDLAVEVVSPNDLYELVEEKLNDYYAARVKLVWVVSPESKTVQIRRADGSCAVVRADGELSGEDVIPGFACKVADLFA